VYIVLVAGLEYFVLRDVPSVAKWKWDGIRKSRKAVGEACDEDDEGSDEEMLPGPADRRFQEMTAPLLAIAPKKAAGRNRGASIGSRSTDSDSNSDQARRTNQNFASAARMTKSELEELVAQTAKEALKHDAETIEEPNIFASTVASTAVGETAVAPDEFVDQTAEEELIPEAECSELPHVPQSILVTTKQNFVSTVVSTAAGMTAAEFEELVAQTAEEELKRKAECSEAPYIPQSILATLTADDSEAACNEPFSGTAASRKRWSRAKSFLLEHHKPRGFLGVVKAAVKPRATTLHPSLHTTAPLQRQKGPLDHRQDVTVPDPLDTLLGFPSAAPAPNQRLPSPRTPLAPATAVRPNQAVQHSQADIDIL
jgi:hypothetical protein